MKKPTLVEMYADNGSHSHWEILHPETGVILWSSGTCYTCKHIEMSCGKECESPIDEKCPSHEPLDPTLKN